MLLFSDSVTREGQGQASLQPLLAIARALSLVQGRKSLLYFSEGLAVPPSVEDLFQSMVSTANRSNVSVYAFDARGLRVRSPTEETKLALDLARETAFSDQVGGAVPDEAVPTLGIDPSEMSRDALRLNRQGVLRDLAESTGGFLVAETNDLRPGLERVVADLRAYYEVGYVPPTPKADGRWRAISVKVSRPGVVVRTRRGYYALPPGAPVVLPYELALAEALAASPMPHDVEHRAATLRFAGGEAQTETLVWVEVPLAGLALTPGETTYRGHVSLLGQVKDETGTLVARLSHDAPIEGPLAELASARGRTTVVRRTLRLPPGRYVLETAVQDRESGRVGARRAAFEIPAPGPSLSLGSVAIVRADEVGAVAPAPTTLCARAGCARPRFSAGRSPREHRPSRSSSASTPVPAIALRRWSSSSGGTGRWSRTRSPSCPRPTPAGGSPTSEASRPAASSRACTRSGCVAGRETPRPPRPPRSRSLPGRRSPPSSSRPAPSRTGRTSRSRSRRSSSAPHGTSGSTRGPSATWWPTSRTASGGPTRKEDPHRWRAPSAPTSSSSACGARCPGARSATSTRSTGRRCATGIGGSRGCSPRRGRRRSGGRGRSWTRARATTWGPTAT